MTTNCAADNNWFGTCLLLLFTAQFAGRTWPVGGFRVVIGGTIYGFLWFRLQGCFRFGWLVAAQAGIVIRGTIRRGVGLRA